ncbi:MAG: hypothetical protein IPJ89_03135 [Candidatus Iainarchaeum archaeon]|uniref:Class III signal peptide-containing protein n=1 Tax=Candidatus Iainarchaeum sp. TaxID=3101447 RepID=A0A7T9DIT3_9ARCH|nr:MAG: hypothetical protein IPJ89_03135 [Candidatus Diapherotrites archaeon]
MQPIRARGQGTTEYLIILAIVIVIALVVVGVLGGFGSQGSAVSASQSRSYWTTLQPFALIDWSVPASGTGSLVLKNVSTNSITITDVNWNNSAVDVTDVTLLANQTTTISSSRFTCNNSTGQSYALQVGFTYSTSALTGIKFYGRTPLVGSCQ